VLDEHTLPLLFTRDLLERGGRSQAYRRASSGDLVRVGRGAYVPSAAWAELSYDHRHLLAMRALASARPSAIFSHRSAAIAWRLPMVGPAARRPEVIVRPGESDRSDQSSLLHRTTVDFDVERVDGLAVTSLARTLLDVARRCPAQVSVPMLDHALRHAMVSAEELQIELRRGTHVGRRRADFALAFADSNAGSAGESLSRVELAHLGMPRPETQFEFRDRFGLIGIVDFWWPTLNLIGEFDGLGKYLREEFRGERDVADVVMDEKRREDRLRATRTRPGVARWGWNEARGPSLLRAILSNAIGFGVGSFALRPEVPTQC
jgi:hypothetical protein